MLTAYVGLTAIFMFVSLVAFVIGIFAWLGAKPDDRKVEAQTALTFLGCVFLSLLWPIVLPTLLGFIMAGLFKDAFTSK